MAMSCIAMLLSVIITLYALSFSHGSHPVITSVHISMQQQMRHITVRYEAQEKPVVLWKYMDFISHLDNSTNSFSDSQGEATVRMYVEPSRGRRDYPITAHVHADSYQIDLVINTNDTHPDQPESHTITPLVLRVDTDGVFEFDKGDVVNIDVSLESEDLGSFEVFGSWANIMSFDEFSIPPALLFRRAIPWRSSDRYHRNVFVMPDINITGSDSRVASTTATIDTSERCTDGELLFKASLGFSSQNSRLDSIVLRRWMYLKERSQEAPFKGITFINDPHNNKRVDSVSKRWPYTQADAVGYPKPDVKLYRNCVAVGEPEVEIITIGTPFRTRNIFKFTNVTESHTGTYYFSVSNGATEVTKMNYIDTL